jgi:CubicO group peptidase (beta-lactamase class C family)
VVPNRVSGYTLAPDSQGFTNMRPELLRLPGGAGGIHSTIADLLRWQQALLSRRIIAPESVQAMMTPARLKNGEEASPTSRLRDSPASKYGLGLSVGSENGHAVIGHTGGNPGFSGELNVYPDDRIAFVVLTNTGTGGPRMPGPRRSEQAPQRLQGPPPAGDISQRPSTGISRLLKEMIAGDGQSARRP